MKINIIAAVSDNGVIGNNGKLPWRQSADLARFRQLTMGKPVIMGRKTYESIGKPLPGRTNIILSRNPLEFDNQDCLAVVHIYLAYAYVYYSDNPEISIIGGAEIYKQTLNNCFATHLYITEIHANIEGDAFFPKIDPNEWKEVSRKRYRADDFNQYDYSFVEYERVLR